MAIGRGATGDALAALSNFQKSAGHNETILESGWNKIGVGVYTAPDEITTILTVVVSF